MSQKINFICPECDKSIEGHLALWDMEEPPKGEKAILLKLNSCASGGLYGVYIECPDCGQDIDLMD